MNYLITKSSRCQNSFNYWIIITFLNVYYLWNLRCFNFSYWILIYVWKRSQCIETSGLWSYESRILFSTSLFRWFGYFLKVVAWVSCNCDGSVLLEEWGMIHIRAILFWWILWKHQSIRFMAIFESWRCSMIFWEQKARWLVSISHRVDGSSLRSRRRCLISNWTSLILGGEMPWNGQCELVIAYNALSFGPFLFNFL